MKRNGKRVLVVGCSFIMLFVIWTWLTLSVDVQPTGQKGTAVGVSTFNHWFHQVTGVDMTLYTVTDWLGLVPIAVCTVFGMIGLVQLIKRKSLFKVDIDIIILGLYYIVVILGYIAFEVFPVNYRPILINGRLETSYPSSTTLLVLCVMPTLAEQVKRRVYLCIVRRSIIGFAAVFSVFMVVGRVLSGVHWITDIIAGILLSSGLFCLYKAVVILALNREKEIGGIPWNFMKNCRN